MGLRRAARGMGGGGLTDAAKARADLSDAESQRGSLHRQLDDLTTKLERKDLGPENEYQTIADSCLTLESKECVRRRRPHPPSPRGAACVDLV